MKITEAKQCTAVEAARKVECFGLEVSVGVLRDAVGCRASHADNLNRAKLPLHKSASKMVSQPLRHQ